MNLQNVCLLLVEDEPDLREALQEYLVICGFQVNCAGSAHEAFAVAQKDPPHIILCDLSLPDRRGDTFLEEFHVSHPTCLLYVHSGDSSFVPSASLKACGLPQSHVFAKPTDLSELVQRLRTDLALR